MQYGIQDRRKVYSILDAEGIEIPRYAVLDRDSLDPKRKFYNCMLLFSLNYLFSQLIIKEMLNYTSQFLISNMRSVRYYF